MKKEEEEFQLKTVSKFILGTNLVNLFWYNGKTCKLWVWVFVR